MSAPQTEFVVDRDCPNCRSHDAAKAAAQADLPAEALPAEELGRRWRGFYPVSCFFTYSRCPHCGQMYAPRYLSPAALDSLYGSMSDNIHSGDAASSGSTQANYVKMISKHAGKGTRYLEIGPDTGLLTREIAKRYPVEAAYLVEPNREVWPELEKCFAVGVAQIAPDISAFENVIADGSLDLVVGIHVLDHLLEPAKTLSWIERKLAPGGVIAAVVHNEGSLLARILGRRWPAFCMQHPELFNPRTIASILQRAGFTPRRVLRTANYFPIGYLIEHGLLALLKIKINLGFLRLPVRLKLGNIMAIATKEN
jgi:SAM-dependent methyltransferase